MNTIKYPSEEAVNKAIAEDEPLLALISFDGKTAIISQIDEAMEHHILLMKAGYKDTDIAKFFRIVLDKSGAGWTFALRIIRGYNSMISVLKPSTRMALLLFQNFCTLSDTLLESIFPRGIAVILTLLKMTYIKKSLRRNLLRLCFYSPILALMYFSR